MKRTHTLHVQKGFRRRSSYDEYDISVGTFRVVRQWGNLAFEPVFGIEYEYEVSIKINCES